MNPQILTRIAISCSCLFVAWLMGDVELHGDISLPKIFSDHMVLQRDSRVKVWGTADPNQPLVVKFAGKVVKVTATAKGDWNVVINTPGAGGPYELEVIADGGEPKVVFNDVMVGEVWLCCGQDNMELPVRKSLNAETEVEQAKNFPSLRLFSMGNYSSVEPMENIYKAIPWRVCSPESVKDFSASGYFFGRELSKKLGDPNGERVPIGLIDVAWGGTVCEAWISRATQDGVKSLKPLLKHWDEDVAQPLSPLRPGNLYNGMIAPLKRFPIRGVIWYQGESNVGRGNQYATLLPTLIRDWRKNFGLGEFPFYFVQLAPFEYPEKPFESLAEVWDAQLKTLKSVENTRMVVTTDIGDLQQLSPPNKQEVGRRLALAALADVYADQLPEGEGRPVYSGPIFDGATVAEDGAIRVTFKYTHDGLEIRNDEPDLLGFMICGEDGKFFPAAAKIDGQRVELRSLKVKKPKFVRFGWDKDNPPNLVNSQGLPASPFRTDDFDLISKGREF